MTTSLHEAMKEGKHGRVALLMTQVLSASGRANGKRIFRNHAPDFQSVAFPLDQLKRKDQNTLNST